jgi:hypothetical protein
MWGRLRAATWDEKRMAIAHAALEEEEGEEEDVEEEGEDGKGGAAKEADGCDT